MKSKVSILHIGAYALIANNIYLPITVWEVFLYLYFYNLYDYIGNKSSPNLYIGKRSRL